jgi:hypothetical protein
MKLTKGIISRDEAFALSPDYVKYIEGDWDSLFKKVLPLFEKLRQRQVVITFVEGVYVKCKVSSINYNTYQAVDGPVVRVGNGEYTWRVDGDRYAYPIGRG